VLTLANLGLRDSKATSPILHPLLYLENVPIGHSRQRHASRLVDRVSVGFDKFRENVDISVRIFISAIFVHHIANRSMRAFDDGAFNFGILTHLKKNALTF